MSQPADEYVIRELKRVNRSILADFNRLLPQLSTSARPLSYLGLWQVVLTPGTKVVIARATTSRGEIIGFMLYHTVWQLVGGKGWIEDVVVDEARRGCGISKAMLRFTMKRVPKRVKHINLTSNPARTAAHQLYLGEGFALRDTGVYRLQNVRYTG